MTSFFERNPFSTLVGQKIEQATDASLPSENWALNMEICDIINETEDGPKDAIKAIKKRLTQNAARNFTVVLYTLTVLETCVKNCGKRFHILVCNKEFVQELVKLIGPKNDPPTAVQEKVLSLVQCWADAFRNQPELNGVQLVYLDLKQKGIEFPMTDLDTMAPIHTPQRSLPEEVGTPAVPHSNSDCVSPTTMLSSDQLGKLTSELQVVEGNMMVLSEMLSELTPGQEHASDLQLLQELHSTCKVMQQRLVELISQLSNDEITAELLRVNDGLNNLFLRYNRYENNRGVRTDDKNSVETSSACAGAAAAASLIDLSENATGLNEQLVGLNLNKSGSAMSQLKSIPTVTAQNTRDDDFDMFAQSRNVTYESSKTTGSSYEANLDPSPLLGGLGATAQTRGVSSMHSERDFTEMQAWLDNRPTAEAAGATVAAAPEESITSSEFERFLAERAAAAEGLPVAGETSSSARRRREKTSEDPMLAL